MSSLEAKREDETADQPSSHLRLATSDSFSTGAVLRATNALAQVSPQPGTNVRYFYQQNTGTFFHLLLARSSKDAYVFKLSKK